MIWVVRFLIEKLIFKLLGDEKKVSETKGKKAEWCYSYLLFADMMFLWNGST